ncbi:MAG TPA: SsrA-binding protein SmpB [Candidatus Hydrogenedentes bacterium]|jgi:SsrA-binding protein|nr:SsrA-binding protein SmpB [FCB group bacterium]NLT60938.1 SsrA-binding protein SmpB [Candidatus Hydrogenedentota bacterium]HNV00457.1 SsrA-binding protein SmpB [Verrucomicrobiota bacterium]HNZ20001.1 SsrA-binding protein SmpB [Candidatus Hydrogenedentota bacterium]HOH35481.1 SsrA-binding protein SmpB [Candidatus Hydrogenedentota bacterium]
MGEKTIVQNRRARHDYHILEQFETGIALQGTEVKSIRAGQITLKDSYAEVDGGELFLIGVHIAPYEQGNIYNHDPERRRKLLMHKREIVRIGHTIAEKGFTLVPLRVYFKDGRAKVELGLCRGKHTIDKRQTLRKREQDRDVDRALKDLKRKK